MNRKSLGQRRDSARLSTVLALVFAFGALSTADAATLSSVTLNASTIVGGNGLLGSVNLSGAAPVGGAVVTLSSSNTAKLTVPASVTVPAGQSAWTFPLTTLGVATGGSVIVTGVYGTTKTASITISPADLSSQTLLPASVVGGNPSTATVTLNGKTPPGGATLTLSVSNSSAVQVPATLVLPANVSTGTFAVITLGVSGALGVSVSSVYRSVTKSATLGLTPASIVSLTGPSSIARGSAGTLTATLDGKPPSGGGLVSISTSDTTLLQSPSTGVTISAQNSSTNFAVKTITAGLSKSGSVSATYRGVTKTLGIAVPAMQPMRGLSGDYWADIILGKPDFSEVTPNVTTPYRLSNPGGVLVDRSSVPNRIYVWDGVNSRVLGYSSIGACSSFGGIPHLCTENRFGDCELSCAIQTGKYLYSQGTTCYEGSTDPSLGPCVATVGGIPATLVLGQPDFTRSACNGDGNFQHYPDRAAARADSLCGMHDRQHSPTESGFYASMAVDSAGNLYVPDFHNSRVLRYNSPFSTDTVADYVWGQGSGNFSGNECNKGNGTGNATNQSLCFGLDPASGGQRGFAAGVAIDSAGNLWVADTENNRVLRFPSSGGIPSQTANLVLGQEDFSGTASGDGLDRMNAPSAVRVASNGTVYVADTQPNSGEPPKGRVLVFAPPLVSGMNATSTLGANLREPTGLEFDPTTGGIWVNDTGHNQLLLFVSGPQPYRVLLTDLQTTGTECGAGSFVGDGEKKYWPGEELHPAEFGFHDTSKLCSVWGGIGVDGSGNVFAAGSGDDDDIWRFPYPLPPPHAGQAHSADKRIAVSYQRAMPNHVNEASIYSARGVAVFEGATKQLIVSDAGRLLFWNDPLSATNGEAADGWLGGYLFGAPSPYVHDPNQHFGRIRVGSGGPTGKLLWVLHGPVIEIYTLPLTTGATPYKQIASGVPILNRPPGSIITWDSLLTIGGIAPNASGNRVWVADPRRHRVFRMRVDNLDAPIADVVLGQVEVGAGSGVLTTGCNRSPGADNPPPNPTSSTLCQPGAVALDPQGNVYVADHALESEGNRRMLEFDATQFAQSATNPVFGLPANRVFGAQGSFTTVPCDGALTDPGCSPWEPAFTSTGIMVYSGNPIINGSRFPLVYNTPLTDQNYSLQLSDFSSNSYSGTFDSQNNYYVADKNRARVLIYKNPFSIP